MQRPSTGADIYLAVVYPHCHEAIDFAPGKEENLDRNEWNELWVHDFTDIKYFQPNEDIFFRIHAGRFGRQMLFVRYSPDTQMMEELILILSRTSIPLAR